MAHPWRRLDKSMVELLVYYQEPMLIGWTLNDIARTGPETVRGLVMDILAEEDYTATTRYMAILEAIAAGKTRLTEIAMWLGSRGLLQAATTGAITKYLDIMTWTGLLEKIPVHGKKKHVYRHVSPLTHLIYYMEARYSASDTPLPHSYKTRILKQVTPLLVEVFVERLLSQAYGLKPVKVLEPEIDIALTRHKRLEIVGEVKWWTSLSRRDLTRIEESLSRVPARERLLVVPDKSIPPRPTMLRVLDIVDLRVIAGKTLMSTM